jgi:hypothetical protein
MSVQRYTWDRVADCTAALYEELLANYAAVGQCVAH